MDYFTYTIKEEPITKQKYIGWGDVYHIVNGTYSKEIIVDLDFNVKDGKPCLHFRYNGFKLRVKDKVYFLDTLNLLAFFVQGLAKNKICVNIFNIVIY